MAYIEYSHAGPYDRSAALTRAVEVAALHRRCSTGVHGERRPVKDAEQRRMQTRCCMLHSDALLQHDMP